MGFIAGTVTDAESGDPLGGAVIAVLDTPLSAVTDAPGEYNLEVVTGKFFQKSRKKALDSAVGDIILV
jgi:hypothetical protein